MNWRVVRVLAISGVATAVLLFAVLRSSHREKTITTYFTNAAGLRLGAPVEIAGVVMGSVKSLRVRPELKAEPVEVVMGLNPPYEIKIPSDSIVSLATAGVLGETYAEIETATASGPPIGRHAVLKSLPVTEMTTEQSLDELKEWERKIGDCDKQSANGFGPKSETRKTSRK